MGAGTDPSPAVEATGREEAGAAMGAGVADAGVVAGCVAAAVGGKGARCTITNPS
jgi:hypothetical protein